MLLLSGATVTCTTTGFAFEMNQIDACNGGGSGTNGGDLGNGYSYTQGYNGDIYIFYTSTINIGTAENPSYATNTTYEGTITVFSAPAGVDITIAPPTEDSPDLPEQTITLDVPSSEVNSSSLSDFANTLTNTETDIDTNTDIDNTTDNSTDVDYSILWALLQNPIPVATSNGSDVISTSAGGTSSTTTINQSPCKGVINGVQRADPLTSMKIQGTKKGVQGGFFGWTRIDPKY